MSLIQLQPTWSSLNVTTHPAVGVHRLFPEFRKTPEKNDSKSASTARIKIYQDGYTNLTHITTPATKHWLLVPTLRSLWVGRQNMQLVHSMCTKLLTLLFSHLLHVARFAREDALAVCCVFLLSSKVIVYNPVRFKLFGYEPTRLQTRPLAGATRAITQTTMRKRWILISSCSVLTILMKSITFHGIMRCRCPTSGWVEKASIHFAISSLLPLFGA